MLTQRPQPLDKLLVASIGDHKPVRSAAAAQMGRDSPSGGFLEASCRAQPLPHDQHMDLQDRTVRQQLQCSVNYNTTLQHIVDMYPGPPAKFR